MSHHSIFLYIEQCSIKSISSKVFYFEVFPGQTSSIDCPHKVVCFFPVQLFIRKQCCFVSQTFRSFVFLQPILWNEKRFQRRKILDLFTTQVFYLNENVTKFYLNCLLKSKKNLEKWREDDRYIYIFFIYLLIYMPKQSSWARVA